MIILAVGNVSKRDFLLWHVKWCLKMLNVLNSGAASVFVECNIWNCFVRRIRETENVFK